MLRTKHRLTDSELSMLENALTCAADTYDQDAIDQAENGNPRLAEQFRRQGAEVDKLIKLLGGFPTVTIERDD